MIDMEGLTVREMAENLCLEQPTVKMRLRIAGIKPISYAGPTALYDPSAQETIRNVPGRGRPKKAAESEKPAKPAKKSKK